MVEAMPAVAEDMAEAINACDQSPHESGCKCCGAVSCRVRGAQSFAAGTFSCVALKHSQIILI
jgi:hypothetical protein